MPGWVWAADLEQRDRLDASVLHAVIEEQLTVGYRVPVPPAFPNFSPDRLRGHRRSTVGLDRGSSSRAVGVCEFA
ncbi:MAG: hypothetical protein H0U22_01385 [Geodermatophilaceae bacterium]|nr:hypothetical protein [Geodermatophilaceae bacterium]